MRTIDAVGPAPDTSVTLPVVLCVFIHSRPNVRSTKLKAATASSGE